MARATINLLEELVLLISLSDDWVRRGGGFAGGSVVEAGAMLDLFSRRSGSPGGGMSDGNWSPREDTAAGDTAGGRQVPWLLPASRLGWWAELE